MNDEIRVLFLNPEQYFDFEKEPSNLELRLPILNCGLNIRHRDHIYQRDLRAHGRQEMNEAVWRQTLEFDPHLVIYSTTWPHESLDASVLKKILNKGIPILTHVWDTHIEPAPHEWDWFTSCSHFAVADSVTNFSRYHSLARHLGSPEVLLTTGNLVFTDVFQRKPLQKIFDVAMVGSMEGGRVAFINAVSSRLASKGRNLHVAGGLVDSKKGSGRDAASDGWVSPEKYADILNQSRIGLSTQTDPHRSQIKGKVFHYMSCGILCLTDRNAEIEQIIPDDCVVYFESEEDCAEKIHYYLENEAELNRIATGGYDWFHNTFDYKKFWSATLPAILEQKHFSKPAWLRTPAPAPLLFSSARTSDESGTPELARNFSGGNFAAVAQGEADGSWRHFAAQGLVGNTRPALEGLAQFGNPEARFYSGVSSWIFGDDAAALKTLEGIDLPAAVRLRELISRPRIDVLTQCPAGSSQYVPDFSSCAEDRFRIKNIATEGGDGLRHSRVSPGTDVRDFLSGDFSPAFYLCREIEWMALPTNLHKLECPVFGHTEDYDIHVQAIFSQYGLFDSVVTCGSHEWNALSRMLPVPVCTFPKAYGLQNGLPELGKDKRDIDLFFSGTIFHPYHPDKAKFVNGLLDRVDDSLNLKVISSHLLPDDYFKLLGRTKICLPYVRFDGSMPTRGMEALAMGNALIVQKGCSLPAYFGEEDGVFTCDYSSAELPALIEKISKNWPDVAPQAERGARRIREEFSMRKVTSEYLRFLTVLAAMAPRREKHALGDTRSKRSVISVGWTHDSDYYLESLAAMSRNFADTAWFSPTAINDFARELLLFHATSADQKVVDKITRWGRWPVPVPEFLGKALDLLRGGIAMFPRFLALQFNLMRALHHFGGAAVEVGKMAEAIAESHESDWDIGPLDDVLPYDFFPDHFNYRSYFDLTVNVLSERKERAPGLFPLIRASAAHYLTMAGGSVECARKAVEWDPEFPLYRVDLAKRLAATKSFRQEAAQILAALAGEDIIPLGAWDELQKLNLSSELPPETAQALAVRIGRIRARIEQKR
ncbi:MAG: glycosyltransferase [Nibricoccus sp.]